MSDDFTKLFNEVSLVSMLDVVTFEKFGKTSKRIKDVGQYQVIYIGVESINEAYQYYFSQAESEYEITTKYIKSGQIDTMDKYNFDRSAKDI